MQLAFVGCLAVSVNGCPLFQSSFPRSARRPGRVATFWPPQIAEIGGRPGPAAGMQATQVPCNRGAKYQSG